MLQHVESQNGFSAFLGFGKKAKEKREVRKEEKAEKKSEKTAMKQARKDTKVEKKKAKVDIKKSRATAKIMRAESKQTLADQGLSASGGIFGGIKDTIGSLLNRNGVENVEGVTEGYEPEYSESPLAPSGANSQSGNSEPFYKKTWFYITAGVAGLLTVGVVLMVVLKGRAKA